MKMSLVHWGKLFSAGWDNVIPHCSWEELGKEFRYLAISNSFLMGIKKLLYLLLLYLQKALLDTCNFITEFSIFLRAGFSALPTCAVE